MVLEGPLFGQYFEKVQATNFEVASDAFQTFKDLLTRHKPLVGTYLNSHYEEVSPCHSVHSSCLGSLGRCWAGSRLSLHAMQLASQNAD